jgi:hypothetical protein
MITNNHSWSLGSCSNKSFEPTFRLETPVRPLHPGDHPFSKAHPNCVHPQGTYGAQHSPVNSSPLFTAHHEISRRKYLISRVCTTLHVNKKIFHAKLIQAKLQGKPVDSRNCQMGPITRINPLLSSYNSLKIRVIHLNPPKKSFQKAATRGSWPPNE